jgi:hypothetical protein
MSLTSRIKDVGHKLKAYGALTAIRLWIKLKLSKIGVMTKLVINAESKVIHLELDLKGDPAPLTVDIEGYQFQELDGKTFMELGRINTSRAWINVVLDTYVPKRQFPVPDIFKIAM